MFTNLPCFTFNFPNVKFNKGASSIKDRGELLSKIDVQLAALSVPFFLIFLKESIFWTKKSTFSANSCTN